MIGLMGVTVSECEWVDESSSSCHKGMIPMLKECQNKRKP